MAGRRFGADMHGQLNPRVIENVREPTGQQLILEVDGCLSLYAHDEDLFLGKRLSDRLKSEQHWFEKLVSHPVGVGSFYEDTLRGLLDDVLPSKVKSGTGFIFDPLKRKYSRQMDILVYRDDSFPVLFRRGDFVVVHPENVFSQAEVKKTLRIGDVGNIIDSTINSNFGTRQGGPMNCNFIYIFSYGSRCKTERIFREVEENLRDYVNDFRVKTPDGRSGTLHTNSIVLPQFYFFDRNKSICTQLIQEDECCFRIELSILGVSGSDGLNDFLDGMTSNDSIEGPQGRNFRTYPIHNIHHSLSIDGKVFLNYQLGMLEILKMFPDEADLIRNFRSNGDRPFMATIPSTIKLARIKSFSDIINCPHVMWRTMPKVDEDNI